jgi:hypothetical protein
MATTIERPGVQVIQEFRTTSPTILVPALPACVLGPCFQIVEAVQDDGSLNTSAQVTTPARIAFSFVGGGYNVGTLALQLSVNNAAPVTVTFSTGPSLTPVQVADEINTAAIAGLVADVEVRSSTSRVVLRTTSMGGNASIEIGAATSAGVLPEFGVLIGYRAVGSLGYTNYLNFDVAQPSYPDPRANLASLDIDYSTVRVFIANGAGSFVEVLETQSFLDGDSSSVTVFDDGDGDNLSPYLDFAGANFKVSAASLTGSVDWTTLSYAASPAGDFDGLILDLEVDGVSVSVTFALPADATAAAAQIDAALGINGTCVLNGSNQPVITSASTGAASSVQIMGTSTINLPTIGFSIGDYAAGKPAPARAQGTADLTALVYPDPASVANRVLRMAVDGDSFQQLKFPATGINSEVDIAQAINDLWGPVASINDAGQLVLTSLASFGGRESTIRLDKSASDATLVSTLGLVGAGAEPFGPAYAPGVPATAAVFGGAYAPEVGDEVWVNGLRLGDIVEIPVSPDNRLRISNEQRLPPPATLGTTWYIVAKGLSNSAATATRPSSDLIVDMATGAVLVKHELFRDTAGVPTLAGPLSTYLGYNALRKDVSPAEEDFNLLRIGSITDLETQLSPIDTQNPLALGMYFAILNAPTLEVTGCGVADVSAAEPEGTLDAYASAFEFIESKDVYAIAPLTHSLDVGDIAQAHVDAMSLPANGLERIAILNPTRPTRKSATLVASGPTANVAGAPTNDVNTGVANLQALLAAAGLPGPSYTISDAVYLEMENDTNRYLVQSVSGGLVTINNGPLVTGNDDDFYYDAAGGSVFTSAVLDRPFSIKIRGAAIANRTDEATAYADIARGFLDRRVVCTAPDKAKATLDGLETLIEGYYLAAGLAGRISSKNPQQPLTEDTLTGFSGVMGSQDRYSEAQLQILSGGGLWVFYQQADGQPVRNRHQLTTDMTSIEKRELSVTTALDFASKLIRSSLRNFIGRFNITQSIQDAITTTLEGLRNFLLRLGVFKSFEVNAIRQSESQPDTLEIDITIGVLYPLNYIRVTLVV